MKEQKITAESLTEKFGMAAHVENGAFALRHYPSTEEGRPASGAILFYAPPHQHTKFHKLDCDEYWSYVEGAPLELWQFDEEGKLAIYYLGVEAGCEPILFFRRGTTFGSRPLPGREEGTFLNCITVPRYTDEGFTLYEDEEMLRRFPETKEFFKNAEFGMRNAE